MAELFGHNGLETGITIQSLILHLLSQLGFDATMQLTLALSSSAALQALLEAYPVLKTFFTTFKKLKKYLRKFFI